jgi:hypothetical protein
MKDVTKNIGFKHVIGAIIILAFFSGHIIMMYKPIPEQNKEAFIHSLGMLDAAVIAIVSFYYGSSSGSKTKGEAISEALKEQSK